MDLNMPKHSNQTEYYWTNEKHLHYLHSMEASFVRTMLHDNGGGSDLRLDRYMPDSSESTLDLKSQRRKKHRSADLVGPARTRTRLEGRVDKRTRRFSSHHKQYDPSTEDEQVVPQLENITSDKDERELPNAAA